MEQPISKYQSILHTIIATAVVLLIAATMSMILGSVVALIWNLGVGAIFGLHNISAWQAIGLIFIIKLLMFEIKTK
jgi:hypothetical protein